MERKEIRRNFATAVNEEELIRGCSKQERTGQRALYEIYFVKMMQVCIRYAKQPQEAKEILLDGFRNIFNDFSRFSEEAAKKKKTGGWISLEDWIKREMIESAIRYMHANRKEYLVSSTVSVRDSERTAAAEISDEQLVQSLTRPMVISALQQLSAPHRTIYNLFEIDGYSHEEISKLLDISEYSSKDSLSKAKFNLKKNLIKMIPNKA